MKNIFKFGEKVKGYDVLVLNEREVRAASGILFVFAIIAFMNSWLLGNFVFTKIFIVVFITDFFIRVFINPKFSPSLILARFFVSNQKVEYVGAPQKRFAWGMGLILGIIIFYTMVLNNIVGPINMIICISCLILFGFESFFGICIGCKMYNIFNKNKSQLCPGGTCETFKKEKIQKISIFQILIFLIFIFSIYFIGQYFLEKNSINTFNKVESNIYKIDNLNDDCEVPKWAIEIGHEEKWKLHHGCK